MFDKRGEGLFKEEMTGSEMVALCSKTYVIERDGEYKLSCKGINKRAVKSPMAIMKEVLSTEKRKSGVNRGFRAHANTIFTYTQQRVGFNYFYAKRKILDDGIHSRPLDLVLNPWPLLHRHMFPPDQKNPLCISYPFQIEMDQLKFVSVEHYLLFSSTLNQSGMEKAIEIQRL